MNKISQNGSTSLAALVITSLLLSLGGTGIAANYTTHFRDQLQTALSRLLIETDTHTKTEVLETSEKTESEVSAKSAGETSVSEESIDDSEFEDEEDESTVEAQSSLEIQLQLNSKN